MEKPRLFFGGGGSLQVRNKVVLFDPHVNGAESDSFKPCLSCRLDQFPLTWHQSTFHIPVPSQFFHCIFTRNAIHNTNSITLVRLQYHMDGCHSDTDSTLRFCVLVIYHYTMESKTYMEIQTISLWLKFCSQWDLLQSAKSLKHMKFIHGK